MSVLVITGTGTGVGKTAVTAAVAALSVAAGCRVAVLKPAQTGVTGDEPGDVAEVARLASGVTCRELHRYPDPLAPATAARRAGLPPVRLAEIAAAVSELATGHDLVLVEGAGGLAVRLDDTGATLADVAASLGVPVLLVAAAGLGTLNVTSLTCEALARRGVACTGVVIGSWPQVPDIAACCNLRDLPEVAGAPLLGALPAYATRQPGKPFLQLSRAALAPRLGGEFAAAEFVARYVDWPLVPGLRQGVMRVASTMPPTAMPPTAMPPTGADWPGAEPSRRAEEQRL